MKQRAGGRVAGGSRERQSARGRGHRPGEEATTARRNKAARGRTRGRRRKRRATRTAPAGPARPAALTPAPAGVAAAARPHAPEPEPRRRRASSAPPHAAAAALDARDATPAAPDAKRATAPEHAARRGLRDARNFPDSQRSDSPRLTLSQQAPSSTNSRQNSNPREIPPDAFPSPSPPPLPFFLTPRFHPAPALLFPSQPPRRARRLAPPAE